MIGVVGGGQMGSGIAQLAAMHGIDVCLLDTDPQALVRATASISASINHLVSKGRLSHVRNCYLRLIFRELKKLFDGLNSKISVLYYYFHCQG